ncbi:hypothetical protein GCM10010212_36450 [Paenarthrobacter nicotinovorans]|nr:hypothetical protein GCM10010212_36450 [Paenarthrobacter nicotinovorans]
MPARTATALTAVEAAAAVGTFAVFRERVFFVIVDAFHNSIVLSIVVTEGVSAIVNDISISIAVSMEVREGLVEGRGR